MSARIVISSALVWVGLLAVAGVSYAAPATDTQPCVFEKYAPTLATQFNAEPAIDYGSYEELKGALLFIPAREGLTREWLELSIQRALAQKPASKSADVACNPPDADKIQVKVSSAGNGFWVQLVSSDPKSSKEILQWTSRVVQKQHVAQATAKH